MEENKNLDDTQMHAAYLTDKGKGKLEYGVLERPKPGRGQVLIRVEAAPLNPSDIYCMEGRYGEFADFKYPFTPGWEGSGTVIESGGGIHAWYLNGKRVAFSKCNEDLTGGEIKVGGCYAQYAITNAYQCVPLDDDVSFSAGASFFVNPMTAVGLEEEVRKDRGTSVILTAGASQLAKMITRLLSNDVTVISTVRKETQREELHKAFPEALDNGRLIVLNTEDDGFLEEFKNTVKENNCKHLLECIAGSMCGKLLSVMPEKSKVVLYGALSRSNVSEIDPFSIINNQLILKGFLLTHWVESKNLLSLIFIIRKVKGMLQNDLSSEIQKEYDLKDIKDAIAFYEDNMSGGKVILKPWGVEN
ncbi:unnamed protein product [Moneuplotes crassus]|uniref:Enoyl reductase (ER) domain-containing protein n=1 Tax=Euplotes crassus TaxID=5936 RepID=A0AAD1UPR9_EUPCR|nr:unnamed protein product [Moneuplotes crassus]